MTASNIKHANFTFNNCLPCFDAFGMAYFELLQQNETTPVPVEAALNTTVAPTNVDLGFCLKKTLLNSKTLYLYALIPALGVIGFLAVVSKRKSKSHECCWGHPGLVFPMNLLQDYQNRFTIATAFALTAWQMLSLILGTDLYPFPLQNPSTELKAFYVLAACIIYALLYYPIFACLSAKTTVSCGLGTLYVWASAIIFIMNNRYCWHGDKRALALDLAEDTPAWFCLAWLCGVFPFRFWTKCSKSKFAQKFVHSNQPRYQAQHIANLFKKNHSEFAESNRLKKWFSCMIYRPIPAFKYSTTMFAAAFCATIFVWMAAISTLQTYYLTLQHFDNATRVAIKAYKQAVSMKANVKPAIELISDPYLRQIYQIVAQFEDAGDVLNVATLEEMYYWFQVIQACIYTALVISLFSAIAHLCRTLVSYRKDLLDVYRGNYSNIPKLIETGPRGALINYAGFIGYQTGYATWGFLIQMFVLFIVLMIACTFCTIVFKYRQYWMIEWIFRKIYAVIFVAFGLMLTQNLMTFLIFLQKNSLGVRVLLLDNRHFFFNFHYFSTFASIVVGMFSCLLRIIKSLMCGLWFIPRLDMSTLNRYFEWFDPGFQSYVGLLTVENAQSNPVMLAFVKHLYDSLPEQNENFIKTGSKVNPSCNAILYCVVQL